jgi:hypothetical protein
MKLSFIALAVLLLALIGFAAWVRLAPSDLARWHVSPSQGSLAPNKVNAETGGATLLLPDISLAQMDAVAMATPRTARFAGSEDEGRITYITRSALWGFPDYTTVQSTPEGLLLHARLRFGESDMGVNAARLRDWQSRL